MANIEYKSATPLNGEVYLCFEHLCRSLQTFCSVADEQSSTRLKLLLCQCTTRASKIICSVGCYGYVCEIPDVTLEDRISHMSSAIHALSSSIISIRKYCGTRYQSVSMVFWSACEALTCMIERSLRLRRIDDTSRAVAGGKQVFNALRMTAPVPDDLYVEIKYLQSVQASVLTFTDMEKEKEDRFSRTLSYSGRFSPPSSPREPCCAFKLHYLIDGLQVMLRAGILDCKRDKQR